VIILLASAAISFVLAILEGGDDKTAFVDPAVVSTILPRSLCICINTLD
jgi:Ca2+ transporting ATPase